MQDIQNIKGLWLSGNKDHLHISLEKLDLMCKSFRILHLGNLIEVEGTCKRLENLIFSQGAVPCLPFDVMEIKDLKYLSYQPKDLKLFEASLRLLFFHPLNEDKMWSFIISKSLNYGSLIHSIICRCRPILDTWSLMEGFPMLVKSTRGIWSSLTGCEY